MPLEPACSATDTNITRQTHPPAQCSADNQAPVALDDVFYIGSGSSAAFNVLENDADYECTDHGYYTTRPICDMYVVNFTPPLYGTVKFPDSQPIFPWDRSQAAAAGSTAAAAAAKMSGAMSPAAAGGGGSIRDWKQNGLLQYALNYSIPRPLIDKARHGHSRALSGMCIPLRCTFETRLQHARCLLALPVWASHSACPQAVAACLGPLSCTCLC